MLGQRGGEQVLFEAEHRAEEGIKCCYTDAFCVLMSLTCPAWTCSRRSQASKAHDDANARELHIHKKILRYVWNDIPKWCTSTKHSRWTSLPFQSCLKFHSNPHFFKQVPRQKALHAGDVEYCLFFNAMSASSEWPEGQQMNAEWNKPEKDGCLVKKKERKKEKSEKESYECSAKRSSNGELSFIVRTFLRGWSLMRAGWLKRFDGTQRRERWSLLGDSRSFK